MKTLIDGINAQINNAISRISTLKSQVSALNTFMNKYQSMLEVIYSG